MAGNVTCSPIVSSPSVSVSITAAVAIPSRSVARQTSSGSPTGSAAATNNNHRASSGNASSRRAKLLCDPPRQSPGPQQPEPA